MIGYIKISRKFEDGSPVAHPPVVDVVETDTVPNLNTLQECVGGLIEPMFTIQSPVRKNHSLTGYVNEEGLIINLPVYGAVNDRYGFRPFAGDMVIVGLNERTGDTVLLNENEIEWLRRRIVSDPFNLVVEIN